MNGKSFAKGFSMWVSGFCAFGAMVQATHDNMGTFSILLFFSILNLVLSINNKEAK